MAMAELACLPKEFSWLHSPNTRIWQGTNPSCHGHRIYSWVHISCNLAYRQTLLNEYPQYPGSFLPAATRQPDWLGPNLSVADCLSKHSLFLSLSQNTIQTQSKIWTRALAHLSSRTPRYPKPLDLRGV
jgi:hypothetical protein